MKKKLLRAAILIASTMSLAQNTVAQEKPPKLITEALQSGTGYRMYLLYQPIRGSYTPAAYSGEAGVFTGFIQTLGVGKFKGEEYLEFIDVNCRKGLLKSGKDPFREWTPREKNTTGKAIFDAICSD